MVCEIQRTLADWSPALFLGYNSIRFDEEFLRQAFYQCLHPTFLTNTNNNARADVLNMMRAVACLRPGVLQVPRDPEGRQVFRLADLAAANGVAPGGAHDAMRDVELTLQLCQRVREGAPDIWSSFMRFASKQAVIAFIREEPAFGYFDDFEGTRSVRPLTRIGISALDTNIHYCLDLTHDIGALRRLTESELAEAVQTKSTSPIRRLKVNASPFVSPLWEIGVANLEPADEDELMRSAQAVQSDQEFVARLVAAARTTDRTYPPSEHVELQIYGTGWPSNDDLAACRQFHEAAWEARLDIALGLSDPRFRRLGRRIVYFERPELLRPGDRLAFDEEVRRRVRGAKSEFPWMTLPEALVEVDGLLANSTPSEYGRLRALREEFAAHQQLNRMTGL
ncbi:exodeoxyribonuclease I [Pseudolabrys sp. Root1462]|uniref:exodeoxyribonuclease I n=1 Tax=Pseudolabrys sp. Root1462 TaxID=1736466 RepID=UPI0012E3B883|nr:exodeoxyribonuclease I [Pseudolabrys sp. Root1462]